ncbi:hypothetical protein ONZ51_g2096 [Trametes cubensis]|uniref:Uncharacterized protein n=1 Tax=Trametes cubensis TaxID=1111947 RepID=A0AAD7U2J1_9APHY|nr:hypothetical protein ONZ51_g2096 [Trametes cubensis]
MDADLLPCRALESDGESEDTKGLQPIRSDSASQCDLALDLIQVGRTYGLRTGPETGVLRAPVSRRIRVGRKNIPGTSACARCYPPASSTAYALPPTRLSRVLRIAPPRLARLKRLYCRAIRDVVTGRQAKWEASDLQLRRDSRPQTSGSSAILRR